VQVDARKTGLKGNEALAVVKDVDEIYVSRGKQVVHLDLKKDKPIKSVLIALLLGPTGNLRAPTWRKGRTLVVGFDEATYEKVLAG
jgi:arsenate reductase-like glutaredoxin family protein